jgi:hypothetical protein
MSEHGRIACPHKVSGPIVQSSPVVEVNLPTASNALAVTGTGGQHMPGASRLEDWVRGHDKHGCVTWTHRETGQVVHGFVNVRTQKEEKICPEQHD